MNCSVCGGDKAFLGKLGNVNYYRCQNCGMQSMKKIETCKHPNLQEGVVNEGDCACGCRNYNWCPDWDATVEVDNT